MLKSRRVSALLGLWRALRRTRQAGAPGWGERLRAMPRMVGAVRDGRYPHLGKGRLALFLVGLAYLVSPVDFMPEFALAFFGLGDDALVAMWLAGAFLNETDRFLSWERSTPSVVPGEVL